MTAQRLFEVASCIICGGSDSVAAGSWKQTDPPVCGNCCGAAAPGPAYEPCPLEHGHPEGCVFWQQTLREPDKRRKNGVRVIDEHGKVLCMADFRGTIGAAEAALLVSISRPVYSKEASDGPR